jgi:predicted ester cyclase
VTVNGNDTAADTAADVAVASLHATGSGTLTDFEGFYTADAVNREARTEPPDTRGTGPAAMYATAGWLRTAFSDLSWQVHEVVQDNDLVVVHAMMSGRQTGPFVAYRPDGEVAAAFPPRGRTFRVTQTHWFRMSDGKVAEHWANRDDLGRHTTQAPPHHVAGRCPTNAAAGDQRNDRLRFDRAVRRSRATVTRATCDGRPSLSRAGDSPAVALRCSRQQPLSPARVRRAPSQLAFRLRIGGAAQLGHHDHPRLTG